LDVADLIEESGQEADAALLDHTDFERTDVPTDKLCIPIRPCVSSHLKEQAKEWVLAVSLDQRVEQVSIHLTYILILNTDNHSFYAF
jgi:intraflagellar transport protein 172